MLELIVAMGIGTLLLTQCSKSKQANKTAKSSRRSSEKRGQQLVQESQMGGVEPVNNGEAGGGEPSKRATKSKKMVEPKGKSSRDERNADGCGGGGDPEGGEKQKTKTNKSRQSKKKKSEAQGPSSTKPSKPMDGTQGNQTDAQKTSNAGTEDKEPIPAGVCPAMEATVYELWNPVCNDLAKLNRMTGDVTEVQYKGGIDADVGLQDRENEMICKQIHDTWPARREKIAKAMADRARNPGYKGKLLEDSEKSEATEVPAGKRVKVNNKKSLVYETREQITEDLEDEQQKNGA